MKQRVKKEKRKKEMRTTSETSGMMLNVTIFKNRCPRRGKQKERDKKKLEEIIVKNFPKMGKEIATQAQETQSVPNRINLR